MKNPVFIKYYLLIVIVSTYTSHTQVQPGWEVLSSGIGFGLENLYFLNSQIGFSTIDHDGVTAPLIRTSNGGLSWNFVYSGDGYVRSIHFPTNNKGYISYYENETKILSSADLGETWENLSSPLNFLVTAIFFTDSITGFAAGGLSNGRIAKTTDGGLTWLVTSFSSLIRSIHFPSPDTGYAVSNDQSSPKIYKTTDAGLTWNLQNAPSGVGTLGQVHFSNNNVGYVVSRRSSPLLGYIIKTENGGLNWYIQYSLPDIILRSVFAVDESTAYVVGDYGTILKTTNGGLNWYSQKSSTTEILRSVFFVDSLIGYVAGGSYIGTPMHVVLKTITGGEPIIPVELTSLTANVDENIVNLFWTTGTETNNRGFEIERQAGIKQYAVNNWDKIGFVEGKGTTTETQFYSFIDQGLTPGSYLYRLKQIDFDGIYEYSDAIELEVLPPDNLILNQNYPNPFNPETVISWQLPLAGKVTLIIYDVLGKKVAMLIDEDQQSGRYEINFDAEGLPNGIYLCRLRTGIGEKVIKLLLLK
jgi:photosystem II stability/assembly factor-like uncharacterized protein